MSLLGWPIGLFIAIGIPLGVLVVATFWPQSVSKGRSVQEIRARIDREDAEGD
ncbi:hypothetical protein [Nocardia transvalensis]|uniref:hypothetical protein n=1 Tax=Nocardia transvalensis TaxID=37333 RepID=UPI0018948930|nr:hypothetical protein [Nocardia transvalensis]MBF6326945.1 hypothetical protein [Nocardia transvalensis]